MRKTGCIVLMLLILGWVGAWGLKVSPGAFCAQGVEVGKKIDTGLDIAIDNDTAYEQGFEIKVVPARIPSDPSLRGYQPLPDLSWFKLEKTEASAPPFGKAKSRIYFDIPAGDKYNNQHWIVSCLVQPKRGGMFRAAVATTYMIETKSKANPKERPFGSLGVAPSVLSVISGKTGKGFGTFKIYNNSSGSRTYILSAFIPKAASGKLTINSSRNFSWGDPSWIKLDPVKVKLAKGEAAEVKVSSNLPKEINSSEILVFVESHKKEKNFIRVWLEKGGESGK